MPPNINISDIVKVHRINGSLERGGWEMRFQALRDTDIVETNYGVDLYWTGAFGSGDFESVGRLAFRGHVVPLQFAFDMVGSTADFLAQTSDGFLRKGWLQGIGFVDTGANARNHYHQFDSVTGGGGAERMTMGRIVRHILGYYDQLGAPPATNPDWVAHGNLVYHATQNPHGWIDISNVETAPFSYPGYMTGSMRTDRYIVRETNNLWDTIRQIATNEFFVAYFNKENDLYYCRHPMFGTLPTPVMEFDSAFSLGKPVVTIRDTQQIRQVKLHAVTDDGDTLHSEYPSSATHTYGNIEERSYIRCNNQNTLDEWARVLYLFMNREHTVRWMAPGVCGLLFELLDRVDVTYSGTSANGVHINWSNKKFWIHDITVIPNLYFSGITTFILEEESL